MTGRHLHLLIILHDICMSLSCHLYVTRTFLFVIRKSLICVRISFVCPSYVLVYVICMSLVCTRMSHIYVFIISRFIMFFENYCHNYLGKRNDKIWETNTIFVNITQNNVVVINLLLNTKKSFFWIAKYLHDLTDVVLSMCVTWFTFYFFEF